MKSDLEITQELRDKLRGRYGDIVDYIRMRRLKNSNDYEMYAMFFNRFRKSPISNQHIIENSMNKLCDCIEKMLFDRKPNVDSPIPNINIRVSDRIPEGTIFISPKTYREMKANLSDRNL